MIVPSEEQFAVLAARRLHPDRPLKVNACAGAGKTFLLSELAASCARPSLYVVFNKRMQLDAQTRMPGHVECRTPHALAFRAMRMFDRKDRLRGRLMGRDVAEMFTLPALDGFRSSQWGQWAIDTVREFCLSTDPEIGPRHANMLPPKSGYTDLVIRCARRLWNEICADDGRVPIEHDHYLKMWQLSGAKLPICADIIYKDEAQDANPVVLDILRQVGRPVVYVGDRFQSIYRFRKAVNAMELVDADTFGLSQSYRFGPVVAQIANAILSHASAPPEFVIRGNPDRCTEVTTIKPGARHTVLCRTNAGVFAEAIAGNDRVHVVGGVDEILKLLLAGWRFRNGEAVSGVPSLVRFRTYEEMREYAEEAGDPELRLLDKLIQDHGEHIPDLANDLQARAVPTEEGAQRVLATTHGAKGGEWDRVRLGSDFPTLDELESDEDGVVKKSAEEIDDELKLLYVAATRARCVLEVNEAVRSCVYRWREKRAPLVGRVA